MGVLLTTRYDSLLNLHRGLFAVISVLMLARTCVMDRIRLRMRKRKLGFGSLKVLFPGNDILKSSFTNRYMRFGDSCVAL